MNRLVLGFALCTFSCGASPREDTSSSAAAMTVTDYGWTLPYRGGSGGSYVPWDSCSEGKLMVGIYGNRNSYENQLGIICAALHADGSFGPDEWHWIMGGQQGSYSFVTRCPQGSAMAGVFGYAHTYLDLLGVRCDTPPFVGANVTYFVGGAASGGDFFNDACPNGYATREIFLHVGSWIDGQQTMCSWVQPW